MLRALDSMKLEKFAHLSGKGADYFCPGCGASVVLKAGYYKIPHFAHLPNSDCGYGSGESEKHREIKAALFEHLKTITPYVTVEQRLGDHITDVYAKIGHQRFAYEIQLSPIDPEEIIDRMRTYAAVCQAATVWILYSDEMDCALVAGEVYRIKKWWTFIQRMQLGSLIFFVSGGFQTLRFEEATRWVESTEYGGGYYRALKQSRTVNLSPEAIKFSELRARQCQVNDVLSYSIPFDKIWWRSNGSYS